MRLLCSLSLSMVSACYLWCVLLLCVSAAQSHTSTWVVSHTTLFTHNKPRDLSQGLWWQWQFRSLLMSRDFTFLQWLHWTFKPLLWTTFKSKWRKANFIKPPSSWWTHFRGYSTQPWLLLYTVFHLYSRRQCLPPTWPSRTWTALAFAYNICAHSL